MTTAAIDCIGPDQIGQLRELYQQAWWTRERTLEEIRRMLDQTQVVVGLVETGTGRLVGFTRVLTDFVYRAYIHDVIVVESHRRQSLGAKLMDALVAHPRLRSVEKLILTCQPELVPFYQRWDFRTDWAEQQLMVRSHTG